MILRSNHPPSSGVLRFIAYARLMHFYHSPSPQWNFGVFIAQQTLVVEGTSQICGRYLGSARAKLQAVRVLFKLPVWIQPWMILRSP